MYNVSAKTEIKVENDVRIDYFDIQKLNDLRLGNFCCFSTIEKQKKKKKKCRQQNLPRYTPRRTEVSTQKKKKTSIRLCFAVCAFLTTLTWQAAKPIGVFFYVCSRFDFDLFEHSRQKWKLFCNIFVCSIKNWMEWFFLSLK